MILRPDFIDVRAQRRLRELERFIEDYQLPIVDWRLSNQWLSHIPRPNAVGKLDQDVPAVSTELVDRPSFPHVAAKTFWASSSVTIPEALDGKKVYARMATNAECTVYVNGKVSGGLDVNRQHILLTESAKAGEVFALDLMVFSGREREARSVTAALVTINDAIYSFRHDLRAALGVARTFDTEHPTGVLLWRCIENTLNALNFHEDYDVPDVSAATQVLKDKVSALAEKHPPADLHFYLCGNSHIDVTWLWTFAETRQKMIRTTSTALKYMDELPDYHFAQSQAQLYDFLRQDNPELFEQVKARSAQGQWEFVGGAWVEPDCNITGGESLVRQLLYGQKFWMEHFGRHSETMWLVDTFGYASAMPQIMKKTGLNTFVTQKLTWSETNKFPHSHFDWEGIDGTRIRCVFAQTYVSRVFPDEIINYYKTYPSRDVTPDFLYLYGYGDGGGGPVREDVEIGKRLKSMPLYPQCEFSRVEDALVKIKRSADDYAAEYQYAIPVWKGELYLEFHRGTLTTHAAVKRSNRKSELLLREAEIWASLAKATKGTEYPAELLENAWKKVLLNQFHDILPGTSIPEVYPDVHQLYSEVKTDVEAAIAENFTPSQSQEDASFTVENNDFTVFNSLSFEVTDWAEYEFEGDTNIHVENEFGAFIPFQVLSETGGKVRIGIEATVAGFGSQTYTIRSGKYPEDLQGDADLEASLEKILATWEQSESDLVRLYVGLDAAPKSWGDISAMFDMTKSEVKEAKAQILTKLKEADKQLKEKFLDKLRDLNKKRHAAIPSLKPLHACSHCLKSSLFKVKYDETGRITSIYDKKRNREWLTGKGNDIQVFEDRPNHWDAWDVNDWFEQKPLDILHLDHAEVVETGALRATVRFHYTTPNGSTIHQDVCIYRSIPRIDFKTNMDWHEQHTLLKVAFPVTVHASHATYEIQYGSIERPTSRNTTWEAAKFEVSGHRWTDLSEGHGGVSLLNDGKYGHDIHHNVMRISLLRTPVHPDPQSPSPPFWFLDDPNVFTDQGKHETNYSFFPHDGDWRNGSVRQGYQFNQPLRVVEGSIGWDDAASVDNEAVYIETLKQAEDGNGFILRCYEAHGSRGEVSLKLPFGIGFAEATDMLEQPTAEEEAPVLEDGKMYFSIKPYEIRTFRILPIS